MRNYLDRLYYDDSDCVGNGRNRIRYISKILNVAD